MPSTPPSPASPTPAEDTPAPAKSLSLLETVLALLREIPPLISDRVRLLALELHRAQLAVGQLVALALGAAVLAGTGWLALWILVGVLMVHAGVPLVGVLFIIILLNAAGVVLIGLRMKVAVKWLGLPATLRHLTLQPAAASAAAPSAATPAPAPDTVPPTEKSTNPSTSLD